MASNVTQNRNGLQKMRPEIKIGFKNAASKLQEVRDNVWIHYWSLKMRPEVEMDFKNIKMDFKMWPEIEMGFKNGLKMRPRYTGHFKCIVLEI